VSPNDVPRTWKKEGSPSFFLPLTQDPEEGPQFGVGRGVSGIGRGFFVLEDDLVPNADAVKEALPGKGGTGVSCAPQRKPRFCAGPTPVSGWKNPS
jgi:hypothetical protein